LPFGSSRDSRAGSSEPSDALVGVTSQPPSSVRTLILPDEPGVSPRSNSERPRRQISSRILVSVILAASFDRLFSCFGSAAKPWYPEAKPPWNCGCEETTEVAA